jgi:hypothetical protein
MRDERLEHRTQWKIDEGKIGRIILAQEICNYYVLIMCTVLIGCVGEGASQEYCVPE